MEKPTIARNWVGLRVDVEVLVEEFGTRTNHVDHLLKAECPRLFAALENLSNRPEPNWRVDD